MKTLCGTWLVVGLAATLAAKEQGADPRIQVLVYNYAGVSAETLARAEREATRIYSHAGIETEWLDGPLDPRQAAGYPSQFSVSPTRLALRVLSRSMAERAGLSEKTFGQAFLAESGEFGRIAQVCAHCAEELARRHTAPYAMILGYIMAHEVGHLLLGVGGHAPSGLMHVPWYKEELDSIAQGSLLFTSWDGDRMRRQVLARLQTQP